MFSSVVVILSEACHKVCFRLVARYCFVEFSDGNAARQALEMLNSQLIPGTNGVCIVLGTLCVMILLLPSSVKKVQTELG